MYDFSIHECDLVLFDYSAEIKRIKTEKIELIFKHFKGQFAEMDKTHQFFVTGTLSNSQDSID
jgi:hypothetical protein